MARVTVEDCIKKVENRFELIIAASQRAREISNGVQIEVDKDNDKNTVIALREIAQETITQDKLKNDLIEEYQSTNFIEDEEIAELEENTAEESTSSEHENDNISDTNEDPDLAKADGNTENNDNQADKDQDNNDQIISDEENLNPNEELSNEDQDNEDESSNNLE